MYLRRSLLLSGATLLVLMWTLLSGGSGARAMGATPLEDTSESPAGGLEALAAGSARTDPLEGACDRWTVPWVQVRGPGALDPSSYATLITLACKLAVLERDDEVRHPDPGAREHPMNVPPADHENALVFRVHLRALGSTAANGLVRLDRNVRATLEDDTGWHWTSPDLRRGARLGMATSGTVRRVSVFHPQSMRGSDLIRREMYRADESEDLTTVEYWIRFPRQSEAGEPLLTRGTRWLRLRLSDGRNEWVAVWSFLRKENASP